MIVNSAQNVLFSRIREMLPSNVSLAECISEVLNLSNDSAYRRIRGETPLVLDEAAMLCERFGISLDHLFQVVPGATLFNTRKVDARDYNFETYLREILGQLNRLRESPQKEVYYLSKDLPFFYNFSSASLFAFHYYFWMKSIFHHPDFVERKFNPSDPPEIIRKLGESILEAYSAIPSTEICNTECINSIIAQVEYYREAGNFSGVNDIKLIYQGMTDMLNHMKDQAEQGVKFLPGRNPALSQGSYRLFYNRITLGDNTIVTIVNDKKTVYLNYDVMNYMSTRDEEFCKETFARINMLMKRSTMISSTSEKQRNIFFNILIEKIRDRQA